MTVVEALFDKLHWQTEKIWMEKWTDVEKEQLFLFFIAGIAMNKIDYPGETPFINDVKRHEQYREAFNNYYLEAFNKRRGD